MSETTATVNITVSAEATREVVLQSIDHINLGSAYVAQLVNKEDTTCTVVLKGVASTIENIDISSIKAYVDLSGYSPGTHDVPVVVSGQDLTVTYIPKVQSIKVRITTK